MKKISMKMGKNILKNKAFTLIELLAVIVILAIIMLIATPIILDVIESTRYSAFKESVNSAFRTYEVYEAENGFEEKGKVDINNKDFPLKSKFKTGQIYRNEDGEIEIENVSDGMYCASGTKNKLSMVKGSCDILDTSEAEVKVNINKITSNSITVTTEAIDNESGIKGIYYAINDGEYKNGESSYTFTKLESGKKYKINVKVVNGSNVETIIEKEATTLTISMPTYTIDNNDWADSKVVTITYPEITGQTLTYEYSIDNGVTWNIATKTQKVTFTANGSIIARVYDGETWATSNQVQATVFTVDKVNPVPVNALTAILDKTNDMAITNYTSGNKHEMYTFNHNATTQTGALKDYRYIGYDPYNYITFNNETWRIIGVFTIEDKNGNKSQKIKIVKDEPIGNMQIDTTGTGKWSESSLSKYLNGEYYNSLNSKTIIEEVKYYLGGSSSNEGHSAESYYSFERGNQGQEGNIINWIGKIGLIYASDYAYTYALGVDDICYNNTFTCDESNPYYGWLSSYTNYQWTITPYLGSGDLNFNISLTGVLGTSPVMNGNRSYDVRPTIYLSSTVKIIRGTGEVSNPYIIRTE